MLGFRVWCGCFLVCYVVIVLCPVVLFHVMLCRAVRCGAVLCFCRLGVFVVHRRLLMVRCTTDTSVCVSRNGKLSHIGSNSGKDPV